MNTYFAVAGGLAIILLLAHSVVGELLLLRRMTKAGLPGLAPFSLIEAPKWGLTGSTDLTLRTLRFCWHLPSVLGGCCGGILLRLSMPADPSVHLSFIQSAMALSFGACSLIALFVSKGQHPGWVVLLAIAILAWLR